MVAIDDYEAWLAVEPEDSWIFDKLVVARMSGHECGPRGLPVAQAGRYIVRPISNFDGMGLGAVEMFLHDDTRMIPHGFFWCEYFEGDHISVDYTGGEPVLTVLGTKDPMRPLQRFVHWRTVDHTIPLPDFLAGISDKYMHVNCEFINGRLIEVHLRHNPDFAHGNTQMIPVWSGEDTTPPDGFFFIEDTAGYDDERIGIFVN